MGISPDKLGISEFAMLGIEDFTQKHGIFKHGEDNGCESLVQTTRDSLILRNTCITYPDKERYVPSPEKLVENFDGISLPHLLQPRFQVII